MKKEEFEIKARDLILARAYNNFNGKKEAAIQTEKINRIKEIEFKLMKQIENIEFKTIEIEIFNATRNTILTYNLNL